MIFYSFYQHLPLRVKNLSESLLMRTLKPRLVKHFSKFVSVNNLVFDIGAYKGELTEVFLTLGSRVVCIEPQPFCLKKLKKIFSKNSRVTIVGKGVSNFRGKFPFSICRNSKVNSTFSTAWKSHPRFKQRRWEKTIKVDVVTLEHLINKFGIPDFCKIDIEGYEEKVIRSLKTPIPALSYEFDQEFLNDAKKCAYRISQIGNYRFNYSKYFNYSFESDDWMTFEKLNLELDTQINGYLRGDIYAKLF